MLVRSGAATIPATIGDSIHGAIGNVNLALVLEKYTNDIRIMTTLNDAAHSKENILLKNIPVGTPFTIGCVVGSNYMEVYMNGRLYETRTFNANPGDFINGIFPPAETNNGTFVVRNLRIWPHAVSPSVMRELGQPPQNDFNDVAKRQLIRSGPVCT